MWGEKKCLNCGEMFSPKRYSGTFCKPKCRVAFHHKENQRKAWNAAIEKVLRIKALPKAIAAKIKKLLKPDPRHDPGRGEYCYCEDCKAKG